MAQTLNSSFHLENSFSTSAPICTMMSRRFNNLTSPRPLCLRNHITLDTNSPEYQTQKNKQTKSFPYSTKLISLKIPITLTLTFLHFKSPTELGLQQRFATTPVISFPTKTTTTQRNVTFRPLPLSPSQTLSLSPSQSETLARLVDTKCDWGLQRCLVWVL